MVSRYVLNLFPEYPLQRWASQHMQNCCIGREAWNYSIKTPFFKWLLSSTVKPLIPICRNLEIIVLIHFTYQKATEFLLGPVPPPLATSILKKSFLENYKLLGKKVLHRLIRNFYSITIENHILKFQKAIYFRHKIRKLSGQLLPCMVQDILVKSSV